MKLHVTIYLFQNKDLKIVLNLYSFNFSFIFKWRNYYIQIYQNTIVSIYLLLLNVLNPNVNNWIIDSLNIEQSIRIDKPRLKATTRSWKRTKFLSFSWGFFMQSIVSYQHFFFLMRWFFLSHFYFFLLKIQYNYIIE